MIFLSAGNGRDYAKPGHVQEKPLKHRGTEETEVSVLILAVLCFGIEASFPDQPPI
jgi:hypothetical protein